MSAIRALRQLTSSSLRVSSSRIVASSSRAALSRAVLAAPARAFSVSARSFGQGSTDASLSSKLAEELKYELETVSKENDVPEFLKAFKAQGVEDQAFNDEVTLTRTFGNETLRLMFSISDIRAEEDPMDEEALEREENEDHEEEILNTYTIRCSLSVTKNNVPGALSIDMLTQEGGFIVDNVTYYRDTKLATELSAEADWKRRGIYLGPQFETLDVGLQEEIERWLNERGVNESIATFIPEYAEWKEQSEYVKWLEGVKGFIDQ
ncbi:regulatory protein suaprga1 [Moniliophthora roreri]|nr:regulatory protein suaprga1 [Moniliophthora roreri]